jgi:hypothetical protein
MAYDDDDSAGGGGQGLGGVLTRRLGPLPTWGYLAIITVLLGAYYLYEKHKAGTAAPAATATQATAGQVTGAQNVPDYVFQNTVNLPTPPASPAVAAPTPVPPTPTPAPSTSGTMSYTTGGKGERTLAQLATALGTTPQVLIADTINHPGDVNGGKFTNWLQGSNMGTKGNIPHGLTLYYTPGTH